MGITEGESANDSARYGKLRPGRYDVDEAAAPSSLDSELLSRTSAGDTSAYAELWRRHHRAGITAARGLAPSQDPHDLVSEAFTRILALVQDGRGPKGAFRPYMYQVIKAIGIDWGRRQETSSEEIEDFPDPDDIGPWRETAFDRDATVVAFGSLSERWQSVLWYTEVEGLRPREVAKLLGVTANTASALAVRARNALRSAWVEAHLKPDLGDPACQSALKELQRYERGKLTAAASRAVEAHLDGCEVCRGALEELSRMNRQLALVLVGLTVGISAAPALLAALAPATPATATALAAAPTARNGAGAHSAGVTRIAGATGAKATPATLFAAAAASVAIILGTSAILFPGSSPSSTPAHAASDERRTEPSMSHTRSGTGGTSEKSGSGTNASKHAATPVVDASPDETDPTESSGSSGSPSSPGSNPAPEDPTTPAEPVEEPKPEPEPPVVVPVALLNSQCRVGWTGEGSQMATVEGTATYPGTVQLQVTVPGQGTQTLTVETTSSVENWWHSPALTVPFNQLPAGVTIADVAVTAQLITAAHGSSAPIAVNTSACQ